MTAEIAIMNKEAIALASDSAVTMIEESGQKIFTSANKLFAMSKYHPVGIMVYGSAIFMGVPWETIIKIYRKKLGKKKFDTLKGYASGFIAFLDNGNPLFSDSMQNKYLRDSVYGYFIFIKETIIGRVHSIIDEKGEIEDNEIEDIISGIIKEHYDRWENAEMIPSIPERHAEDIISKDGKIIDKAIVDVFENLPLSKDNSDQLKKIAGSLFSKFPKGFQRGDSSGVVIAGFGEKDTFPSLVPSNIEGIVNNKLKYKFDKCIKIGFETNASISYFAQGEMVHRFMEGIDPDLLKYIDGCFSEIFYKYPEIIIEKIGKSANEKMIPIKKLKDMSNKIFKEYQDRVRNYRRKNYVEPIIRVVSMLPKDELAAMAESFVNLTSFKRKVTMESETVGGPIDVAVISKGDGFIWIKRKHYFKSELNPQFLANYSK